MIEKNHEPWKKFHRVDDMIVPGDLYTFFENHKDDHYYDGRSIERNKYYWEGRKRDNKYVIPYS